MNIEVLSSQQNMTLYHHKYYYKIYFSLKHKIITIETVFETGLYWYSKDYRRNPKLHRPIKRET